MHNLILALILAAFPTPNQVRANLAVEDSLRKVMVERYVNCEAEPDFKTQWALIDLRKKIAKGFETHVGAGGFIYLPMGNVEGTTVDRVGLVEAIIRRELADAGWILKEWKYSFGCSQGWLSEFRVEPSAVSKSVMKLQQRKEQKRWNP